MNEYYPDHVLNIPNATPETTDAAQYLYYKGRKQFNMCGQFCVAYIMRDEAHTDSIDDFLNYWEAKDLKYWQTLFKQWVSHPTSIYDIERMLADYGVDKLLQFSFIKMSPIAVSAQLRYFQAIIGVQIDRTGYLVGQGIPHWVALSGINVIDDSHAICDIYNPYTNAIEPYSWREIMNSTGAYKQGRWIPR